MVSVGVSVGARVIGLGLDRLIESPRGGLPLLRAKKTIIYNQNFIKNSQTKISY